MRPSDSSATNKERDAMDFYRVNAVVIRVKDFQEADRLVTLFARERGKLRAVAKGARRPRNRLSGSTQLFCSGVYSLYAGRGLANLNQGQIIEPFISLREDLDKMTYAAYFAELIDMLVEEEAGGDLYPLLLSVFLRLEQGGDAEILARFFEIRLLAALGYKPELGCCADCRKVPVGGGEVWFSPSHGGILCAECTDRTSDAVRISSGTLEMLKRLLSTDAARLHVLKLSYEMRYELERVLRAFVNEHLPRPLKSLDFLQMVKLAERNHMRKDEAHDD